MTGRPIMIVVVALLVLTGCATTQDKAERAFDAWHTTGTNTTALVDTARETLPLLLKEVDLVRLRSDALMKRAALSLDRFDFAMDKLTDHSEAVSGAAVAALNATRGFDPAGNPLPWYRRPAGIAWGLGGLLALSNLSLHRQVRRLKKGSSA